jgi:hypothetical protein
MPAPRVDATEEESASDQLKATRSENSAICDQAIYDLCICGGSTTEREEELELCQSNHQKISENENELS